MKELIWSFKTNTFEIICEEEETGFLDPMVHSAEVIDAVEQHGIVTTVSAKVLRRGVEVGSASVVECIRTFEWDGVHPEHDHGRQLLTDHSYRNEAVRKAIGAARRALATLQSDIPDLLLRRVD
jgi:hypothetical protein